MPDINSIAFNAQRMQNVGDMFSVLTSVVEYLQQLDRELSDKLSNLDSDNIAEIDFARTRIRNLRSEQS